MVENHGSRVFEGTVMLFVAAAVAALGLIGFATAASRNGHPMVAACFAAGVWLFVAVNCVLWWWQ